MTETILAVCACLGLVILWDIRCEVCALRDRLDGETDDEYEPDGS